MLPWYCRLRVGKLIHTLIVCRSSKMVVTRSHAGHRAPTFSSHTDTSASGVWDFCSLKEWLALEKAYDTRGPSSHLAMRCSYASHSFSGFEGPEGVCTCLASQGAPIPPHLAYVRMGTSKKG